MAGYTTLAAEVAREITIAFKEKIRPTDRSTAAELNESYANEVAGFYEVIFNKVKDLTEK